MNISELERIIKEQEEELAAAEFQSPTEQAGPSRCQWPQYWNNLWTQSSEQGIVAAHAELSFEDQKELLNSMSEGEFDDCLYNNQQEAIDLFLLLAKAIAADPFVWTEFLQGRAAWLFNFLYPGELAATRQGMRMAEQELFELLMRRIVTIAKSPFNIPWKSILSRSKTMNPILKSATRAAVGRAGQEAAKQTAKQALKQTGKRAVATLANTLVVAVAGVPDIAVLTAEYLSPEALRSSEYQSMLVKDLILTHRRMYLDRKRNEYYDPENFPLMSNRTLQKVIRVMEDSLEGTNYKYIIYVPAKTAKVDDQETTFFGAVSTADFAAPSSNKFEEAKRLFSLISKKSLSLFFDAMELGWSPLSGDNNRLRELAEYSGAPVDRDELAYFQMYIRISSQSANEGRIVARSPWIKQDRTIVLVDERLSGGEKKEIKVTDYAFGADEETSSTTAYDPISIVTLFGGYEGMPQRDELAYWMKLNYFDLLDKVRKAHLEKNSRET
jgi:hypothetical protein